LDYIGNYNNLHNIFFTVESEKKMRNDMQILSLSFKKSLFFLCMSILLIMNILHGQQASRQKLVAAYLYNFAKNIQWDKQHFPDNFHIYLISSEKEIEKALLSMTESKTVDGKKIIVSISESFSIPSTANLVYIGKNFLSGYRTIFEAVESKKVLLVSDGYDNPRLVMINLFDDKNQTLKFEINRANILNQVLGVLPDMVLLGGTEIDVAKLYKEVQTTLLEQEKSIELLQNEQSNLQREIKSSEEEKEKLRQEIEQQTQLLNEQTNELERLKTVQIPLQEKIDIQTKELDNTDKELTGLLALIHQSKDSLNKLSTEIVTQQKALIEKETTISTQKNILFMLGIIIGLVFILGFTIVRNNRKLSDSKLELEKAKETVEAANLQLKELDKLKSMFIASMSHELRTPLNSIIGFTGMMLQGLAGDLNDEQKDNLSRVYRSGQHLLQLITDVIDISKIEAGRIDVFPQRFSLRTLVEEAIDTIRPQLDRKHLELEIDAPTWPEMTTDRRRLMQCLINYLSNAVKFTEQGTVTIIVREMDSLVDIAVRDTGIGIKESDMPKLFEAFERLESYLRIKAGGTGLGLYLTRKIARDLLHGDVAVESIVDSGSTFSLRIPCALNIPTETKQE